MYLYQISPHHAPNSRPTSLSNAELETMPKTTIVTVPHTNDDEMTQMLTLPLFRSPFGN